MDLGKLADTFRRVKKPSYCGAVIVAAGSATRMKGIDKNIAPLAGVPVIRRTAQVFQNCDAVREIVIVTRPDLIQPITQLCRDLDKVRAVVAGGASRQESVSLGLNALSDKVKLAAIHDGARPLITTQLIDTVIRAADTYGAAAPFIPVKDTIKVCKGGLVEHTPDRKTLMAVQTPQVFDYDILRGALKKAKEEGREVTDDCSAAEMMGVKIKTVTGDERNLKITTPMDLEIAEMLLEGMQCGSDTDTMYIAWSQNGN